MKSKNRVLILAIGIIVFILVFGLTFFMKSKKVSVPSSELFAVAEQMNDVGYVGAQLLFCVDDDRCPGSYDPQSALGLMPFVQNFEDDLFKKLKNTSEASANLAPVLEAVAHCRQHCACAVWSRFLESESGKSFDLDLNLEAEEKVQCPDWSDLSSEQLERANNILKSIEALQN